MSEPNPLKRTRVYEIPNGHNTSLASTPAQNHPDFWFEDGSVILQVANTLFRVHRSLLSKHSEVFADLFSVPQPPEGQTDEIEGLPTVRLYDPLEDFVTFLRAVYEPR